jgi:hypothetical protein
MNPASLMMKGKMACLITINLYSRNKTSIYDHKLGPKWIDRSIKPLEKEYECGKGARSRQKESRNIARS